MGSFRLETSNGDINVDMASSIGLAIDATTSAGAVRNSGIEFASPSLALSGAGAHFKGSIGVNSGSKLTARTFHGDIEFRLATAEMDATEDEPTSPNTPEEELPMPADTVSTEDASTIIQDPPTR